MSREPVVRLESRYVVLDADNVDTDQIIPARFLTSTSRQGLGAGLFADWRTGADGEPDPEFVLNRPEARGAAILVAGDNFGCGSSREHAPWALLEHGFRAVVSTRIADIFTSNALKNGLLPVTVDAGVHARLVEAGGGELVVDLMERTLILEDGTRAGFPVDPFSRYCLLNGIDELGFLLEQRGAIEAFEVARGETVPGT